MIYPLQPPYRRIFTLPINCFEISRRGKLVLECDSISIEATMQAATLVFFKYFVTHVSIFMNYNLRSKGKEPIKQCYSGRRNIIGHIG